MKLSKSENEVLDAIKGIKRLPTIKKRRIEGKTLAGQLFGRYIRHDMAIEKLKQKGIIEKGPDYILRIVKHS